MDHGDQTCVYTWGYEDTAGHKSAETVPRVLETFDGARVLQVRCSSNASIALTANGKVWWWGRLSPQKREVVSTPELIKDLEDVVISHISITTPGGDDFAHCACISDSNDLYMWGNNRYSQIIRSNLSYIEQPIKVMSGIKDVACGDYHTVAIQMNGDVMCWGHVYEGGVILAGVEVVKVAAGGYGFCGALTADHTLYTWCYSKGVSEGNFLGHGESLLYSVVPKPEPVVSLLKNAAVTLNGDLYTWGEGDTNRLGHGEGHLNRSRHKHVPTLVKGMEETNIVRLSLSRGNEGAVTENGDVYTWGGIGHGGHHLYLFVSSNPVPTILPLSSTFFQGASIQDLACGKRHTVIVLRMQKSLQHLCLRTITKHFDNLVARIAMLPEEIREAIGSFMNDRRHWTEERALALALSIPPIPPAPLPVRLRSYDYFLGREPMYDIEDEDEDEDDEEDEDEDDDEDEDEDDDEDEDEDDDNGSDEDFKMGNEEKDGSGDKNGENNNNEMQVV